MRYKGTWIEEEIGPIVIIVGLLVIAAAAILIIRYCGPIIITFSVDIANSIGSAFALSTE